MATTINSYSVSLAMDASSYIKNSTLSRKETMSLAREINAARSPTDKFERSVNLLDKAVKKGAIDQRTYNRLLDSSRDKFKKASTSTDGFAKSLKSLAAGYIGVQTLTSSLASLRDQMQLMDSTAKSSRAIGETFANVTRFQFAASEIAGVSGPEAVNLLGKLTKRVGEASMGLGEASETFKRLNLDIERLKALNPVEQFRMVAKSFAGIESPTIRVAEANKLFEESGVKIIPLLTAEAELFDSAALNADKFGIAVSELDVSKIEATNDALNRLSASLDGVKRSFATELASDDYISAIDRISDSIANASVGFRAFTRLYRDHTAMFTGGGQAFKDFGKDGIRGLLPRTFDLFHGYQKQAADAWSFDFTPKGYTGGKKPREAPMEDAGQDMIGGAIDGMAGGLRDMGRSFADQLTSLSGVITGVGEALMSAQIQSVDELIEATKESPAIKSLEAGTQEAYQYMTEGISKQLEEQQKEEKRHEVMKKNGENVLAAINKAIEVFQENGFKRFR